MNTNNFKYIGACLAWLVFGGILFIPVTWLKYNWDWKESKRLYWMSFNDFYKCIIWSKKW